MQGKLNSYLWLLFHETIQYRLTCAAEAAFWGEHIALLASVIVGHKPTEDCLTGNDQRPMGIYYNECSLHVSHKYLPQNAVLTLPI